MLSTDVLIKKFKNLKKKSKANAHLMLPLTSSPCPRCPRRPPRSSPRYWYFDNQFQFNQRGINIPRTPSICCHKTKSHPKHQLNKYSSSAPLVHAAPVAHHAVHHAGMNKNDYRFFKRSSNYHLLPKLSNEIDFPFPLSKKSLPSSPRGSPRRPPRCSPCPRCPPRPCRCVDNDTH